MHQKCRRIPAIAVCMVLLHIGAFGQVAADAPLPDITEFWNRVRSNLGAQYDANQLLRGYRYRRTSVIEELGSNGSIESRERREYDVYQFDAGRFQRLLSRNG